MKEIKRRRKELGLKATELAAIVGVSPGFICQVERGECKPSLKTASKIAKALGCTVDDLLKE